MNAESTENTEHYNSEFSVLYAFYYFSVHGKVERDYSTILIATE